MTGNGSVTGTKQSSQLLPGRRVVPGMTVPVAVAIAYPPAGHDVAVGGTVLVGMGVRVAVGGVPVTVGVGVPPPVTQLGNLNDPMRSRQPTPLVVGTYSSSYQKVQSSTGSKCMVV